MPWLKINGHGNIGKATA